MELASNRHRRSLHNRPQNQRSIYPKPTDPARIGLDGSYPPKIPTSRLQLTVFASRQRCHHCSLYHSLLLGMACSTAFALTSLWVREASLSIGLPFPHSAAWVLFLVISLQTVIICTYLFFRERDTLRQIFTKSKLVVMTSLASVIGSLGWFSAMSLQAVPYVKTLGQIEVVFMVLISYFWLGQSIARKDILALILLSIAAVLVMWQ